MRGTDVARIEDPWPGEGAPVRSIVLVLHGGQARSTVPAGRRRFSYLRMYAFARSLQRRNSRHGTSIRLRPWAGPWWRRRAPCAARSCSAPPARPTASCPGTS